MESLKLFLIIAGFVGLTLAMLGISYIIKRREFRGTCSSNNPMVAEKLGSTCSLCGKTADEACKK